MYFFLLDSGHHRHDKNKNYRMSYIATYGVGKNEKAGKNDDCWCACNSRNTKSKDCLRTICLSLI